MDFLRKLSAAITGDLLFRLVYTFEKIILFPITCYRIFRAREIGWKILAGIFSAIASLFFVTSWVFNPFAMIGVVLPLSIINHTLEYGFKGALTGWEQGFKGVFEHVVARFYVIRCVLTGSPDYPVRLNLHFDPELFNVNLRPERFNVNLNPPRLNVNLNHEPFNWHMAPLRFRIPLGRDLGRIPNHMPPFPVNEPYTAPVRPSLELSDAEFLVLQENQRCLFNAEERTWLESVSDAGIKKQADEYLTLWNRLEGECCITQDRPANSDVVVLVKLRTVNGQESPIPISSHIFDRASLMHWIADHNTHPVTRDLIVNAEKPLERYVVHPYYPTSESTSGISQELSDLVGILRPHLPKPPQSKEEIIRAARLLRFYSSPLAANQDEALNTQSVTLR